MKDHMLPSVRQPVASLSKAARMQSSLFLHQKKAEPQVKAWIQNGATGSSFVIILPTQGCSWALSEYGGCTICGYLEDTYCGDSDFKATQLQFKKAMDLIPFPPPRTIKLFNSGSFFDEQEMPIWLRQEIFSKIESIEGVDQLIIETRPDTINDDSMKAAKESLPTKSLTIALGLETSNNVIRRDCINKGFSISEFEQAVNLISEYGFRKKAYILLKPPFLTEAEAISDCVSSALYAERIGIDEISINPVNIQRNTLLEKLWKRNSFRPPWLWSLKLAVQQILNQTSDIDVFCEPVGAGTSRGAHNCGQCDRIILSSMRRLPTSEWKNLKFLDCACLDMWRALLEDEARSYLIEDFSHSFSF